LSEWDAFPVAANMTVSAGSRGVSNAEAKNQAAANTQATQARGVLEGIAQQMALSRLVPPGRLGAAVALQEGKLPKGWQRGSVPIFQMMEGNATGLIQPTAELISGKPLGASQMNTPAEFQIWERAGVSEKIEPEALNFRGNHLGRLALQRIARTTFEKKWREANGSVERADKSGRTIDEAWNQFLQSPTAAPLNKPMTEYLAAARQRRLSKQNAGNAEIDALVKKWAR
jgi:hypothetical protein